MSDRVTDFAALTAQNRQLLEDLREKKYADVITGFDNIKYIHGMGRLLKRDGSFSITVNSSHTGIPQELSADRVILATGVRTSLPRQLLAELEKVPYLTNETAYFETTLPESLIVLGGGYVAVEAAQMFARLGSKVTLLQRSSHILSDVGEDIGRALTGYLREEGIEVTAGLEVLSVAFDGANVVVTATSPDRKRQTFQASKLFVATGRCANTENVSDLPL